MLWYNKKNYFFFPTIIHLFSFLLSISIIWVFSGLLVDAVDRVSKRFNKSGFTVAFFVLGFMTSISELSVMVNSTLNGTPQVSAGNLPGASLLLLLLIVPMLAVFANGIQLQTVLKKQQLALALGVVALPVLCLADGVVTSIEGIFCLGAYGVLLYFIRKIKQDDVPAVLQGVEYELLHKKHAHMKDMSIIIGGALAIFLSGHVLVDEVVYFSESLGVPSSIIALLVLSIGTNIPEIVIAIRSLRKHHADIAFGDYMGSSVANTLIFGMLSIFNGVFRVESSEFITTALFTIVGFSLLFLLSQSGKCLSRKEGIGLLGVYALFVLSQAGLFVYFFIK